MKNLIFGAHLRSASFLDRAHSHSSCLFSDHSSLEMTALALSEEAGRRICMLTEFMFGKPVFESYKSLCSKIGDETISYQEFDFWFHRFAQGKLDLSYDSRYFD